MFNFFFRLLLTREDLTIHHMAMEVLKHVIKAAQEKLDIEKKNKLRGKFLTEFLLSNVYYSEVFVRLVSNIEVEKFFVE